MFQEKEYIGYDMIGEFLGFLVALLIFISILFFIILRRIFSIKYFDLVGIIILFYLIYVIIKLLMLKKE